MGGLLFVSQAILDTWASQGKIDFSGNVMTTVAGKVAGRSYRLEPAVRFLQVAGAETDPNGLLRKVKSEAQLREAGAEVMGSSVLLGDVAYEVEPGFLAEAEALQAAAASQARPAERTSPPPLPGSSGAPGIRTPTPKDAEERRREAEELARFLLDHLS